MINYTFTDKNGVNYRRITKANARNAFLKGENVVICPSNLCPFTMWHCECNLNINSDNCKFEIETGRDARGLFDYLVTMFIYYNCTNAETGRRANFYIAEK